MQMQLSGHFTLEEMTFSSTAIRLGLDNTPSPEVVANLTTLCGTLETIRECLDEPMTIYSGYRSLALNAAVHGVPTSAHVLGWAADFICPAYGTPREIVKEIASWDGFDFDQLIQEGTWVHISVAPTMRRQVLTATFKSGVASYREGIAS
jgi:hypothetical protein